MKTNSKLVLLILITLFAGCAQSDKENAGTSTNAEPTGKQYIAASEPADAVPVGEARQNAKDGDPITLVGHIGGSKDPFINGIAAFTIVDPKIPYCQPEEGCPTPWDYCCTQNEVKNNIAMIKIVDQQDKPVAEDARRLLCVKELSLVVVKGNAKRDEQGNLSVMASKVFVKE